jgi:membrane protein YdbS with pleckstrin-like domain
MAHVEPAYRRIRQLEDLLERKQRTVGNLQFILGIAVLLLAMALLALNAQRTGDDPRRPLRGLLFVGVMTRVWLLWASSQMSREN